MSAFLKVRGLTKVYPSAGDGPKGGVRSIDVDLSAGMFFTLLGPSGCGKTTTLRCIAGLETPDSGRIEVADQALFDHEDGTMVPANRRNFGMVFQSYAIWPHLTVFENVAFPLRVAKDRKFSQEENSLARPSCARRCEFGRLRRSLGDTTVWRSAAARSACKSHRTTTQTSATRRAALKPRCCVARRDEKRATTVTARDGHHDDLRDS